MFAFVFITATAAVAPAAQAASFVVSSTADAVDAVPRNGVCATGTGACSLRAAVQEANALVGLDTITVPPGVYELSVTGRNEDLSATGDLDVRSPLAIVGAEPRRP